MSGMVFPQSPAPEKAGQASEPRPSVAREKHSDSEFDSVSRQEQVNAERRLQMRRQERADRAERAAESKAQDTEVEQRQSAAAMADSGIREAEEGSPADGTPPATESAGADPGGQGTDDASDLASADLVVAPESPLVEVETDETAVFTFADLRSMAMSGEDAAAEVGPALTDRSLRKGGYAAQNPVMAGTAEVSGAKGLPGLTGGSFMETMALTPATSQGSDSGDLVAARLVPLSDLTTPASQLTAGGQKVAEQAAMLRGYATSIEVPVGHAEWGDKLVGKLTWLTANNMSSAEIHLTPPDMGPMEVRVQLNRDHQAAVTVHSANPVVRDQLELHSHRLRDMLSEQGIDLGRFEVADRGGQGSGQWSSRGDEDGSGRGGSSGLPGDDAGTEGAPADGGSVELAWKGELDLYA